MNTIHLIGDVDREVTAPREGPTPAGDGVPGAMPNCFDGTLATAA